MIGRENSADPKDPEGAGSDHGADGRVESMATSPKGTCRYLIKIADGFEGKDAQDSRNSTFYNGLVRAEETGEEATEYKNAINRNGA